MIYQRYIENAISGHTKNAKVLKVVNLRQLFLYSFLCFSYYFEGKIEKCLHVHLEETSINILQPLKVTMVTMDKQSSVW